MGHRFAAAIFLGLGIAAMPHLAQAQDQPKSLEHQIPQSVHLGHVLTVEYLGEISHRPGDIGAEATKLLAMYKAHMAKEEEYILPPLTLLPALARGEFRPDMKWALAMSDRVRAEQNEIFQTHVAVIGQAVALSHAAELANDNDVRDWVRSSIIDDMGDLEMMEPMSVLVGDILRAKLPK